MDWKKALYNAGNEIEINLDLLKLKFRENLGWNLPVQICPYITYGVSDNIYLRGRVMNNRTILPSENDTLFDNLVNSYKRFASEEIASAQMKVKCGDTEFYFESDEDGYFEFPLLLKTSLPTQQLWHQPLIELLNCRVKFQQPYYAHGQVMTPPVTSQFGIISDIDDTVIPTDAESLFKAAILTFTKNQFTRFPFNGVPEFYRSLQKGISGDNFNPLFYVSSSPWNLFDLLKDFMEVNDIPAGPILLKDYGFTHNKLFTESHVSHKTKMIRNILNTYPLLPFILIGDSGQKDPEIYAKIVEEFPGRIVSIYIRDVSASPRDFDVLNISHSLKKHNVELVNCQTTFNAAEHAANKMFIRESDLALIKAAAGITR